MKSQELAGKQGFGVVLIYIFKDMSPGHLDSE
jgi:hypothetical protein